MAAKDDAWSTANVGWAGVVFGFIGCFFWTGAWVLTVGGLALVALGAIQEDRARKAAEEERRRERARRSAGPEPKWVEAMRSIETDDM